MNTLTKAKELLSEIDSQIKELQVQLKGLTRQRSDVAVLVKSLGGSSAGVSRRGRPAGKRTRTDWDKVIASFKGSFSIDDLAKASKKSKGTVNQAIQNLKKAKKIKPTGKRGEYQRIGASPAKAKGTTKKPAKKALKKAALPKTKAAEQGGGSNQS